MFEFIVNAAEAHDLATQLVPLAHVQLPSDPILDAQLDASPVYDEHDDKVFTQPYPVDLHPA